MQKHDVALAMARSHKMKTQARFYVGHTMREK
jgi:hypothetical protein